MPSTSPGHKSDLHASDDFVQILPGAPAACLQSVDTFVFRHKRYIVYISGRQVNFLSSPTNLVQALTFDDDLVAVAAEHQTGKVAVTGKRLSWVLRPSTEGWTRVWWEKVLCLVREDLRDDASCLSWGNEGEVLVGGSRQLSLFSTLPSSRTSSPLEGGHNIEERKMLWSKRNPSALQYASFSPSASIIATCGVYDRLVKIWRRLSFEEGLFDHTYLPHPANVTHLEWRPLDEYGGERRGSGIGGRHEEDPELLYTIAQDGKLRVWRTGAIHDLDILNLHTTVDLDSAIPQSPSMTTKGFQQSVPARYCFTLSCDEYCNAVTAALGLQTEKLSHALEHIKEMASKEPDVVVSLDGRGRMSAWGLQSIGHKRRPESPSGNSKQAFHIAHAEALPLRIEDGANARVQAWFTDSTLNVLVHGFGGYLQWWKGDVANVFSPATLEAERFQELACWSGHRTSPVTAVSASLNARHLVSCSQGGDVVCWAPNGHGEALYEQSSYASRSPVLAVIMLESSDPQGCYAVLEQPASDSCKLELAIMNSYGTELSRKSCQFEPAKDKAIWSLSTSGTDDQIQSKQVIVGLCSNGAGFLTTASPKTSNGVVLQELQHFSLPSSDSQCALLQSEAVLDSNDTNKIGFVSVNKNGILDLCHLELALQNETLEPVLVSSIETDMLDPGILVVSNDFAAITSNNRHELAIVNLRDGLVEYRHSSIGMIQLIVPSPKLNLLAVAYKTHVDILAQGRYELHDELPAWVQLKQISIETTGLNIDALEWLTNTQLAIAAGNGIFLASGDVSTEQLGEDVQEAISIPAETQPVYRLSEVALQLRKPLPLWHPSVLSHSIRHGLWSSASSLVHLLGHKLKFWSEGDDLHSVLDVRAEHVLDVSAATSGMNFDRDLMADLAQQLDEKHLPDVSRTEQERLKTVIQAMSYCSEHISALDSDALRFCFSWKMQLLEMEQQEKTNGAQANGFHASVPTMHWREIAFAFHSTTQQPLLDILIAHYDNKITWDTARQLGLFAWLADRQALEQIFEAIAQSAYRSTSPPDPINASLYFLALHKKAALLALWRIATWHKEQRSTTNFLKRDFTQADNKTAAKKNAYRLMSTRRFHYAAAFFLLAEDCGSATSILASQCDDTMLAIAVGRLFSGDGSPVLRKLLQERVMPQAVKDGDRWMMSWCHSILLERDLAAEVLVAPLGGVRTWQQDDPNTLTLYQTLRKTESDYEYEAVLRGARILRRMGLWLLALELVSRWKFLPPSSITNPPIRQTGPQTNGVNATSAPSEPPSMLDGFQDTIKPPQSPPSMLDGFSESPPAPIPADNDKAAREKKAAALLAKMKAKKDAAQSTNSEKKPEPTQFKEPDANSLLDSFGF